MKIKQHAKDSMYFLLLNNNLFNADILSVVDPEVIDYCINRS